MKLKTLILYLHTFCRYFIATVILSYAFAKIFETQFTPQPSIYDKPIGSLNGFQLTWFYFGYSYWYGLVIALTQIVSSFLLFFRKTTRLGIILFLSFMINILLIDFAYEIKGAQGMAIVLTIMALFILLVDYKAFYKYLIQEPPLFQNNVRPMWMNKISKLKFIYIPLVFIGLIVLIVTMKNKYMAQNQFYGTWENTTSFERLHFEALNTFQIIKKNETKNFVEGEYSFTKDSIKLINSIGKNINRSNNTQQYLDGKYKISKDSLIISSKTKTAIYKRIR